MKKGLKPMGRISVSIVDDHPVVRDGLAAMLSAKRVFSIAGKYSSGEELLADAERTGTLADVIVMDIRMPGIDGLETLSRLRARHPRAKCILLTGLPLKAEEEEARRLGASAYLPKTTDPDRLSELIRAVATGDPGFATEDSASGEAAPSLTRRELQVLDALRRGFTRDEIAGLLGISSETVKSYMKSIILKLDASNAVSAVARGFELGLLR